MMERIIPIAPHIHALHAPLSSGPAPLANEMVIEQSDGFVLVDAGKTRGAGERIVRLIRQIGDKPVKAVIITHWHPDHVLGLGPIIEAWPHAAVIASRATLESLQTEESYRGMPRALAATGERDRARAAALRGYARQFGPQLRDRRLSAAERRGWADLIGVLDQRIADERGTYLVLPTVTFDDHYRIDDPIAPVEARYLGGAHTAGDVVVWAPRQRVVATGDIVVSPIPYGGTDVLDWPAALRAIARLAPRIVVPGHGAILHGTAFVERMAAALDAFNAAAAGLIDGPLLTDEQVAARVDSSAQEHAFAGRDPWLLYWFRQYFGANPAEAYRELRARRDRPGTAIGPS
jgi:glyoxylase-like metal-dependent hydrolase (beta-lactamase superfamily II)